MELRKPSNFLKFSSFVCMSNNSNDTLTADFDPQRNLQEQGNSNYAATWQQDSLTDPVILHATSLYPIIPQAKICHYKKLVPTESTNLSGT